MLRSPLSPAAMPLPTNNYKKSDLPFRNFVLPSIKSNGRQHDILPSPPDSVPGFSDPWSPDSINDGSVQTPISSIVDIDARSDASRPYGRSVTKADARDTRYHSRSSSRGTSRSGARDGGVRSPPVRANNGVARSAQRQQSLQSKDVISSDERCMRYIQGVVPASAPRDLVAENTGLQQRIAALQRTERDLLTENQKQARYITSLQSQYESQLQKSREQYRGRERMMQARIEELERRVEQQEQKMREKNKNSPKNDSLISDDEVMDWFTTRTGAWQDWADDFAHSDPSRLRSGLLPVQLDELCESVESFIQLEDGGLPDELVNSEDDGVNASQVLLHGMLANFIVEETLQSPFWIFDVLSTAPSDLESPLVSCPNSPIGFRMELAPWSAVAPPRSARLPPKSTMVVKEPLSARRLQTPRTPASAIPLSLNTNCPPVAPAQQLPGRKEMESLHQLLSNVQQSSHEMHEWRAQIIRSLSQGGLALEPEELKGEERRRLAEGRKLYAKTLKDKFLGGAARLLLQDQVDGAAIEKLEVRLTEELDFALQFSCLVWSRPDPLRVTGIQGLADKQFAPSEGTMELCPSQVPISFQLLGEVKTSDLPPWYREGSKVVMAVQPIIEFIPLDNQGDGEVSKILSKARVLVAAPKPNMKLAKQAPMKKGETTAPLPSPAASLPELPALIYTAKKKPAPPNTLSKSSFAPGDIILPPSIFSPLVSSRSSWQLTPQLLPKTAYQGWKPSESGKKL